MTEETALDRHQARFVSYWTTRPADELAHALVDSEDEVARLRALIAELAEERSEAIDNAAVLRAVLRSARGEIARMATDGGGFKPATVADPFVGRAEDRMATRILGERARK